MKQVPCYICNKSVTARSNKALAKLCLEHDIKENRAKLIRAKYRDLIRQYNRFKSEAVVNKEEVGTRQPSPTKKTDSPVAKEKERKMGNKKVNEYGEPV